jgi:hypothetical protein
MAQHMINRRGYWSLEQSYRDENGKPRKRILQYFGRSTPEERALDSALRIGRETEALQKKMFGETAVERREREQAKSSLPQGLRLGPTPAVEMEKVVSTSSQERTSETAAISSPAEAEQSEQSAPSEPDAEPSETS